LTITIYNVIKELYDRQGRMSDVAKSYMIDRNVCLM